MRIHHAALSAATTSALAGGDVALVGDAPGCSLSACHGDGTGFARARQQLRTSARPVDGNRCTGCDSGQCRTCRTGGEGF